MSGVPVNETRVAGVADRTSANAEAVTRMTGAEPVLIDVQPAGEAVPGMTDRTILTSGPPMPWSEYYGGQRNAIIYGARGGERRPRKPRILQLL